MECDEVRPCLGYSRSILPFTIRRAAPEGRRTEPGATRVNGRHGMCNETRYDMSLGSRVL